MEWINRIIAIIPSKYTLMKGLDTKVEIAKGILITNAGAVLVLANNNNPWWKYKTNTVAKYLTS